MALRSTFRWIAALLAGPPWPPAVRQALEEDLRNGRVTPEGIARTASRHRISPALSRSLETAGLASHLPEDFRDYCSAMADINRERNVAVAALANRVGELLRKGGVEAVLLKGGASLFDTAHPHRDERFLLDLDLLVDPGSLERAETLLQSAGWYRLPEVGGEGHQLPSLSRAGTPAAIELHYALLSPPYERLLPAGEVLAASSPGPDGLPLRLPSLEHRLIHNAAHAQLADGSLAMGRLELRQLVEFAALASRLSEPESWAAIRQRFSRHRALLALELQMLAAETLLALPSPLPLSRPSTARRMLARARWLEEHPRAASWNDRAMRPGLLLARSLRTPALRRRLWRNLRSPAWRRRQLAVLWGRRT